MDNPNRIKYIVNEGDVYFCCHEYNIGGQVDMERDRNGLREWIVEAPIYLKINEKLQRWKRSPLGEAFLLSFCNDIKGEGIFRKACVFFNSLISNNFFK